MFFPTIRISVVLVFSLCIVSSVYGSDITLTILHVNDVHSRFLEIDKFGGNCGEDAIAAKKCFGGFARIHYKVKEIRRTHPNVAFLSAGDYFQGTLWYTIFKWNAISYFVNQFNHTAMALGNHEFDDNIAGLVPFLEAVTFPVVSCNIDDSEEPTIQHKFEKSTIVEYEGRKVGIIGYTTKETQFLSFPGKLIFNDEIESVKKEAERLDSLGIKIIIAVGHAGYNVDLNIAEQVPLVDLVVGGHTNTFLYQGAPPDVDTPLAEYPTIVTQPNGKKVPVVQAYAFGKYLGYLNITFDDNGDVKSYSGNPILLDGSIPLDETMRLELEVWGKNISQSVKQEIGKTHVLLEGRSKVCRLQECNLGNLIADAMVEMNQKFADNPEWKDAKYAIYNGGGVRSSISETNNGSITTEDILTVLPFQNNFDMIEIEGKYLREAFEYCVEDYDPQGLHLSGKFLQVSGIKVEYDISKPNGQRVRSLKVLCKKCRVPEYVPVVDDEIYKVTLPSYLAGGGDGFTVIRDHTVERHLSGLLDSDIMTEYVQHHSPITVGVEGRSTFYNSEDCTLTATAQIKKKKH